MSTITETLNKMDENTANVQEIDVNDPEFYSKVQDEVESDIARMKKSIELLQNLRLTAAELEVESAALYHAALWHDILKMENIGDDAEITSDEDFAEDMVDDKVNDQIDTQDDEQREPQSV